MNQRVTIIVRKFSMQILYANMAKMLISWQDSPLCCRLLANTRPLMSSIRKHIFSIIRVMRSYQCFLILVHSSEIIGHPKNLRTYISKNILVISILSKYKQKMRLSFEMEFSLIKQLPFCEVSLDLMHELMQELLISCKSEVILGNCTTMNRLSEECIVFDIIKNKFIIILHKFVHYALKSRR